MNARTTARVAPIGANLERISRAGASPASTIHGPGGLIRALVGSTLAVALGGGGVWLKFASMRVAPPQLLQSLSWFGRGDPCGRLKFVNLAQYANNAPPQFRAQARASLQALGDKITALFKQAVVQSFETTWLAAAFGAVVGFILAFVTLVFRRKGSNVQQSGETVEADAALIG